jgi:selenide,water dikinase
VPYGSERPALITLAASEHTATEVSGFDLLGYIRHMLLRATVAAGIVAVAVPVRVGASRLATAGVIPGGSKRNPTYVDPHVRWDRQVGEVERLLLADTQTSGSPLTAVYPEGKVTLLADLARHATPASAVISEIVHAERDRAGDDAES